MVHSLAGLGNAVGAIATARLNAAPLVVLVGQQDRRHVAIEPFVAGRLEGLAGDYPVRVEVPLRAQEVPSAIARAAHAAVSARGPAIVIVPMNDWTEPVAERGEITAPAEVLRPRTCDDEAVNRLVALIDEAQSAVIVTGAGADDQSSWSALVRLAERVGCPVYQEAFGARAGFPQDHPQFVGHLPMGRAAARDALAPYDLIVVVGTSAFRQDVYADVPLVPDGARLAVISANEHEVHRSPADLAVIGAPSALIAALADRVSERPATPCARPTVDVPPLTTADSALQPVHVFAELIARLPTNAVVVEETPSSNEQLRAMLSIRVPGGFASAAMGGLGFGIPAAVGLRMGNSERPVVAIVGDGSTMYQPQAIWTAVRYRVGSLSSSS